MCSSNDLVSPSDRDLGPRGVCTRQIYWKYNLSVFLFIIKHAMSDVVVVKFGQKAVADCRDMSHLQCTHETLSRQFASLHCVSL